MFTKETQKKLKEEYRKYISEVWQDEKMISFCDKKADILIKTEDGFILEVERPDIKTSFCFGYSDSRYDTEDLDRASRMAYYARKNEEYFMNENLEDLQHRIDFYSDTRNKLYFYNHYMSQKSDTLKGIASFKEWEEPADTYKPVSEKDRELIISAYKQEIEDFTKRLRTYLKRYGMSKVRSWTYWQDE